MMLTIHSESKALILAAARDAVGPDAAERLAGMKKAAMAEAAGRGRLATRHSSLTTAD